MVMLETTTTHLDLTRPRNHYPNLPREANALSQCYGDESVKKFTEIANSRIILKYEITTAFSYRGNCGNVSVFEK